MTETEQKLRREIGTFNVVHNLEDIRRNEFDPKEFIKAAEAVREIFEREDARDKATD